nr:glycosyltransferase family 9 protein [Paenibacillus lutrae]
MRSSVYGKVFLLPVSVSAPPLHHIRDLFAKALGFQRPPGQPDREKMDFPQLPSALEQEMASLRETGAPVVGVQFHTGDPKRSWPQSYAQQFVRLCKERNIHLINLSPLPYDLQPEGCRDWSGLAVTGLFAALEGMDAMVGIDSVCGHVAGFLGVPNLTLWGRSFPGLQFPGSRDESHVSFRTLSANYSLVPRSADIRDISPELAFARLKELLDGRICLSAEVITAHDTLNEIGIEWVDGA